MNLAPGLVYAPPTMTRTTARASWALVLAVSPLSARASAAEPDTGRVLAALRYRYEQVDQIGFDEDGEASTLRLALGYETAEWRRMRLLVEFENTTDLGLADAHDNGATGDLDNGVIDRPVIADPEDTEVNQALLHVAASSHFGVVVGREVLNINDDRLVGASAWRQNN